MSATDAAPLSAIDRCRLAAEIVAAYLRVRVSLIRAPLPRVIHTLRHERRDRGGAIALADPRSDGRRLGRAVVRTLRPLPSGSRCLVRSLVLLRLCARRGVLAELVIAAQPTGLLGLDAHAWIEIDGVPILAPAPEYGRLATL